MSLFFVLNNLHFTLEILGALVFMAASWLAFDAYFLKRDFSSFARAMGFLLLFGWQIAHAAGFESELVQYAGYGMLFLGLLFVLLHSAKEATASLPGLAAVIVLPPVNTLFFLFQAASAAGFSGITTLSFRQYQREHKKDLLPFCLSFFFLSLGAFILMFSRQEALELFWIVGHLFEVMGFAMLGWWLWRYVSLRLQESIVLIFVSFALLMASFVTLTFSTILMDRIERETQSGLLVNARLMAFNVERLREEALAKARLLAEDEEITAALAKNNFSKLEQLAGKLMEKEGLGFLTFADKNGDVILRAHAPAQKEDSVSAERAAGKALRGEVISTIESSPPEDLSIRAAAPLYSKTGKLVGALITGFPLDNAFVDNMKRITGFEMSVYYNETRVATTELGPDGRTRGIGVKLNDRRVTEAVLKSGETLTLRTVILSRPYLASFLPLRDDTGAIIGLLSSAKPQQEILNIANATNRLTLAVVVVVMLLLIAPIYGITRRLTNY